VLLLAALCFGAGDAVLVVTGLGNGRSATFVGGDSGITDLLTRRAAAVTSRNESAFLADVDTADPRFVQRQRVEYQNLVALGLSSFTLTLTEPDRYTVPSDSPLISRYDGKVRRVGVTVQYAVSGLDPAPDAEPWVPTFGFTGGRWVLADEAGAGAAQGLPFGVGGQPWEARPVTVVRAAHVVAVISTEDSSISSRLVDLAERGVTNVLKVYKGGWDGKILVTAVSDQKVFDSYFEDSPDKLAQIEAVTIPRYSEVPEWDSRAEVVLSRVVFNPAALGHGDFELQHALTHEFTHAALGLQTSDSTPRWLVEGIAEYVAYATETISDTLPAQLARRVKATDLPSDSSFYSSADNYVLGWLAVKHIAEKYGADKMFAFYKYFQDGSDVDAGFHSVLGTSLAAFTQDWLAYLDKLRAS
jgi:peptidase MA superfamily protein